jgi:uncharacterized membrane protein YfcA
VADHLLAATLAEVVLVGAVSGFVQGLSGFAFGLIATSFWAWMMEPQRVVPLVVMSSVLGQCISIRAVRSQIRIQRVSPFVVGGLIGAPLGAAVLGSLDAVTFRGWFGLGLIVFCSMMLRADQLPRLDAPRPADGCIGFLSGALSGACGMGGPPITLWCSLRNWDALTQRATFQAFFIVMQLQVLALYVWHGLVDRELVRTFLWLAPAIVTFSWLGSRVARKLHGDRLKRLVFALLIVSGVMMLAPVVVRPVLARLAHMVA